MLKITAPRAAKTAKVYVGHSGPQEARGLLAVRPAVKQSKSMMQTATASARFRLRRFPRCGCGPLRPAAARTESTSPRSRNLAHQVNRRSRNLEFDCTYFFLY